MIDRIKQLEVQVEWMQEMIIALIMLQSPLVKIKLRRNYPKIYDLLTKLNSN